MAGNPSSLRSGPSPQPPRSQLNRVFDGPSGRILCVADVRGQHSLLNTLALEANAKAIIHTGDFGFFENSSLDRINERTLRHLLLYSPLIPSDQRDRIIPKDASADTLRSVIRSHPTPLLSEFPLLLSGKLKLSVPVYTVWGACEDVAILERLRGGVYDVENLHVIDEATSRTLEIGGIKLRLLGLGGAFVPHKLFDNGEGQVTIAGGQGTMWATALQIGELVDTAQRTFDQTETRMLVTHASPGREGLLSQLALVVKADLTVSAALHFRYASSWNEFSVQGDMDAYRSKLQSGKDSFHKVWDSVKTQVESTVDDAQKVLLEKVLSVSERIPPPTVQDEPAWKNTWNWNLCDAAFGHLVLDIKEGRVSAELKRFNYAYRRAPPAATNASTPATPDKALPSNVPSPTPAAAVPALPASSENTLKGQSQPNGTLPAAGRGPTPSPAANGVNGETEAHDNAANASEVPTSPKSAIADSTERYGKKRLTPTEKRERKAEKDRPSTADPEGRALNPPSSPAPSTGKGPHKKSGSHGFASPAPTASPALPPSSLRSPVGNESDAASSTHVGAESSPNLRAPPGRNFGRSRNPWTLHVNHLPLPVSEQEIRESFGDAKNAITFVKLMWNNKGPTRLQKSHAFVEFKDEPTMQAALALNSVRIKDQSVRLSIAEPREDPNITSDGQSDPSMPSSHRGGPPSRGSFRGRGAPQGGRGGNLFSRSVAQAAGGNSNFVGRAGGSGMRKGPDSTSGDSKPNGTSVPAE
ncbi:hypothetical protein FRB99_006860 [Tulasnella sp. 403]|nr:hypothetical protein FRB99_006860 [Tulasnella sp. 403]